MTRHTIEQRTTPLHVIVMCSCGWRHQESRRQNARARASKVRAAINQHIQATKETAT